MTSDASPHRSRFLSVRWRIGIGAVLLVSVILGGWFLSRPRVEPFYLALVGPVGGEEVTDMLMGAELCLDQVNQQGGIHGRPVEWLLFDDQNEAELAAAKAQEIADSRALAVVGHFYSSTSLAGGEIYRKVGIPAITPSATADALTADNPWYFRVIPNNRAQAVLLANYARYVLGYTAIGIVYDEGSYGTSLVAPFENTFRGLGGKISYHWSFDTEAPDLEQQYQRIIDGVAEAQPEELGAIFMATYSEDAVPLIAGLRRKGLAYPILSTDTLGDPTFPPMFDGYPEEQVNPGYFSDGVYATAPVLFDIADEQTQQLRDAALESYHVTPGWGVATTCDALLTAVEALRRADVQGRPETLAVDRRHVRDALAQMKSPETAADGITGPIYFDKNRNLAQPMPVGTFANQQFVPAMEQLRSIPDLKRIPDLKQALLEGRVMLVNGQYMYRTNVIYTGLDFNEISDLDMKNSRFTADFYLWFRYRGTLDETQIDFVNAEKVTLGKPVMEKIADGLTYRVYRVKATFKTEFDFSDYPFDRQSLRVQFRHQTLTRDNLIYVQDVVGMRATSDLAILEKLQRTEAFRPTDNWQLEAVRFFQDTTHYDSTLGNPQFFKSDSDVEYANFNAVLHIKRDVTRFVVKNAFPVFLLLVVSFLAFFIAPDALVVRINLGVNALLTTAFFHLKLSGDLPQIGYVVAMEYVFYVIYGLYLLNIIFTIGVYLAHKQDDRSLVFRLNTIGKVVYIVVVVVGVLGLDYHGLVGLMAPRDGHGPVTGPAAATATAPVSSGEVTLRLGAWRTDDAAQMVAILAQFNAQHPGVTVIFDPITDPQYDTVLRTQLERGTAPDLFYLRSYATARTLFEQGYLTPLDDLPGLQTNFDAAARAPWATDDGVPYGVPFIATSHGIYYNATLFAELGLSLPATWEELLAMAQVLKDAGYLPFANGSGDPWTVAELLVMNMAPNFIGGRTGRMAYLSGERCFNDANIVALFTAIQSLAPFLAEDQATLIYAHSQQLFLRGEAAMWLSGSWDIPYFEAQSPAFKWDVMAVPPPAGQPGYVTFHPDAGVGLNAASPHQAEARLFLEWLSTPEAGALLSNELPGFFPMHREQPTLADSHANAFLALNAGRGTDVRFAWEKLMDSLPSGYDLLQDGAIAVLAGEQTPQQAADALQAGLAQWFEPAQICLQAGE